MNRRTAFALVVVVLLSLAGCFFPEPIDPEPDPDPAPFSIYLDILDFELEATDNPFMPWVVTGHAKNKFFLTLGYASVRAQFFDAQDVLLHTGIDNVLELPSGTVWEFNAYFFGSESADRVDHVEVVVGTCFP